MCKEDELPIDNSEPQTKETQAKIKPPNALEILKLGNERFACNKTLRRNLKQAVKTTSEGQFPFAVILSCIDSRVPTELVFDQGIGDIFNVRIAGNFVNNDILGSLEFSYTTGVSLIVVLGHTGCGAIDAAIANCKKENTLKCAHILPMVKNLCPAVKRTERRDGESDTDYQDRVARKNVELNIKKIREKSECLKEAEKKGEINIVGGIYDVTSGVVSFFKYSEN